VVQPILAVVALRELGELAVVEMALKPVLQTLAAAVAGG
jgi:hypothetical protein